jgi:hypothetical protein
MAYAEIARHIEAPADRVWEILSGKEIIKLITSIYGDKVDYQGSGQGAVLRTTLKGGKGAIRERIEYISDEERCLKYRVLDVGPFPFANYQGEIRVTESGPDACNVSFQTNYVPVGIPEQESNVIWLENNKNMLEGLNKYVTA